MPKSMKTERKPTPREKGLDDIPTRKIWDINDPNAPKPITKGQLEAWKAKQEKKNKKVRNGHLYTAITPDKKPFVAKDGEKLV